MTAANEALASEGRRKINDQLERIREEKRRKRARERSALAAYLRKQTEPLSAEEITVGSGASFKADTVKDMLNELVNENVIKRRLETKDERTIRAGGTALSRQAYLYYSGQDRPRVTREIVPGVVLTNAADSAVRRRERKERTRTHDMDLISRLMLTRPAHAWMTEELETQADEVPLPRIRPALQRLTELGVVRETSDGEWRLVSVDDPEPKTPPTPTGQTTAEEPERESVDSMLQRLAEAQERLERLAEPASEPRNRQDERDPIPDDARWESHVVLGGRVHPAHADALEEVREQSRALDERQAPGPTEPTRVVVENMSFLQEILMENERLRAENRQLRRTVKRLAKLAAALA